MKKTQEGIDVVIERLDNLKCIVETNHTENSKEHKGIMERQDHTNGDVTRLKMWRAYLLGAWVVISFTSTVLLPILGYYFMKSVKYEMQEEFKQEISDSISENNNRYFENE